MDMLWPGFLVLLGLIPLLVAAYLWLLRRRRRYPVRFSSLSLVRPALPRHSGLRRHLPAALFLAALACLMLAAARPYAIVSMPVGQATIILAMDVSRSMCSVDIPPSRMEAAQASALSFIRSQPASTQIGVVAFSSFAEIVQAPTSDEELLQAAIDGLATGRRTAIGSAILKAIDAIAEIDPNVAPSVADPSSPNQPTPVPRGAYAPHIIVLLTDGVSNSGPLPLDAAQEAADRGLKLYTIGFGTANGSPMPNCGPQYMGNEPMPGLGGRNGGPNGAPLGGGRNGGGQFGGGNFRRGIDEDTLKKIAALTGGEYYSAESAGELQHVFESLPTYLIARHEITEISFGFVAAGALLAVLAFVLSQWWHPLT